MSDDKHNEPKQEEGFRVIDRRPFTSEGELRPEIVEQEVREAKLEAQREVAKMPSPAASGPQVVPPLPPPTLPSLRPHLKTWSACSAATRPWSWARTQTHVPASR